MNKTLLKIVAAIGIALVSFAQVTTIPNTTGLDFRNRVNTNFSVLDASTSRVVTLNCAGTDDTAAITTAISTANAAGKIIYVNPGTCVHTPITLSTANVYFRLDPKATLKLKNGSTDHQWKINGVDNVTFEGGVMDCNSSGAAGAGACIFLEAATDNFTVKGMHLKNPVSHYVRSKGSTGTVNTRITLVDNIFEGAGDHGIYFNWETTHSVIERNRFIGSTAQNCIWIGNTSTDNRVAFNYITGCGKMGIEVWNGSARTEVSFNKVSIAGTASEAFGISAASSSMVVEGNTITLTTGAAGNIGLEVVECADSRVIGNIIDVGASGYGATIDQCNWVSFSRNRIKSTYSAGIGISMHSSTATGISNNTLEGNQIELTGAGNLKGINVLCNHASATCSNNKIIGNTIKGTTTGSSAGIYLDATLGTALDNQGFGNTIVTFATAIDNPTSGMRYFSYATQCVSNTSVFGGGWTNSKRFEPQCGFSDGTTGVF